MNTSLKINGCLETIVYHFFRQLWLVLGVKLMEINSNLFSRWNIIPWRFGSDHVPFFFMNVMAVGEPAVHLFSGVFGH